MSSQKTQESAAEETIGIDHSMGDSSHSETLRPRHPARWGFLLVVLGLAVIVGALIDMTSGLPFPMPRSWYMLRSAWLLCAVAAIAAGVSLVKTPESDASTMEAGQTTSIDTGGQELRHAKYDSREPSPAFERVVLYTREGCHLCEVAHDLLAKYSRDLPPVEVVDIDADPRLVEQFTTCVPVVEIDGKIRFRGKVNEVLLRRLIRNANRS